MYAFAKLSGTKYVIDDPRYDGTLLVHYTPNLISIYLASNYTPPSLTYKLQNSIRCVMYLSKCLNVIKSTLLGSTMNYLSVFST